MPETLTPEDQLQQDIASFYADPLGFVLYAYPWGEPGSLEKHSGPDQWQVDFLEWLGGEIRERGFNGSDPVAPIRSAVSSGHGIGKSALAAWLTDWIMSTRPHCRGSLTANTISQLRDKTWAAVHKWTGLCITGHWFEVTATRMYQKEHKETWFCAPQSSKEENSEAFAGQHAEESTSFYIFDEASAIPDKIGEVAEGGLTDGEPMWFMLGNCTRSVGRFHSACFGKDRKRWKGWTIDSRTCKLPNKELLQEWENDYGEDSDFFRVRARGLPPRASDAQFIDQDRVAQAQKRQIVVLPDEPLVVGVDLAWGGEDENVVRFRRGRDARSIPAIRIRGEFTRDPEVLVNRLADVLSRTWDGYVVHIMFLDAAGIAGPVGARLRQLGFDNVREINFGADSPDEKCRYHRDYMWQQMKEWLLVGSIDDTPDLETDLTGPGVRPDTKQRVWLESKEDMKKRGLDSPDDGDALALTFASPVYVRPKPPRRTLPQAFQWT